MYNPKKPETNKLCSLLGHKFGHGDKPCLCSRCGEAADTLGRYKLHTWKPEKMEDPDANYCGVYVCTVCGRQGDLLPHDYVQCRCRRCGAIAPYGHEYRLYRITSRINTSTHTEYCNKDRTDDYICNFCTERNCVREVTEKKKVNTYWYKCTICGKEMQTTERRKNPSYTKDRFIDDPSVEEEPPDSEE